MKRRSANKNAPQATWLTTYADLMNNLLVLFIMLYMMSVMDLNKFKALSESLSGTFGGKAVSSEVTGEITDKIEPGISVPTVTDRPLETVEEPVEEPAEETGVMDDLDEFVNRIKSIIWDKGYEDRTIVERVDNYVYFRFREGVLFYPNLASLKPDSYEILNAVSEILVEAYNEIYKIDICGHTAWVPIDNLDTNFNSWELSSERSLTVLKYFVRECGLPKDKFTMSAYSSTEPYTSGITEEEKAMNRRVELRLSRLIDVTKK
jgi:chemotaxis protein MotB